jgi:hypothetical protein
MGIAALELNDRAMALAVDGQVRGIASGVALRDGSGAESVEGLTRLRVAPDSVSSRHWSDIANSRRASPSAVAAARNDLASRLRAAGEGALLHLIAPPRFTSSALSQVLALARLQNARIGAFVDSAALAVAALGLRRTALVIDLGLQHIGVARVQIELDGKEPVAHRRKALVGERGGWLNLQELWLDLVSEAMVRRTRFDPLHEGATEQKLFDALPAATQRAAHDGEAEVRVESGGQMFAVTLTRDQFAVPAQPVYRELLGILHELRPAGVPLAIVAPQTLLDLPGLRAMLDVFAGCELHAVPDGAVAAAWSERAAEHTAQAASSGVRLLRRVPMAAIASNASIARTLALGSANAVEVAPTHLLHGGQALSLGAAPLEIGRDTRVRGVVLPDGLAGVSRRHCTLRPVAGAVVLIDHSRFGTFVNGERVANRVRLRAGDVLRIGDPGIELNLIAVGGHGATPTS